jgi:putative transposase
MYELAVHFSHISLDEFVVMPNHIHGIIIIETLTVPTLHATSVLNLHATSVQTQFMSEISPKPGSLASVIRSYKSAVSKNVHLIDSDFSWHPRYYDHIIHSRKELERIRQYIINNPGRWDDKG